MVLIFSVFAIAVLTTYAPAILFRHWKVAQLKRHTRGRLVLTYDDGPTALCPEILQTLRQYQAKATFFLLGSEVAANPGIVDQLAAEGHEIAAHSFRHVHGWKFPVHAIFDQMKGFRAVAPWSTAGQPPLYRPPYGKSNSWALIAGALAGAVPVWWTVDSRDSWPRELPSPDEVLSQLEQGQGGVLLLHDYRGDRNSARSRYTVELTGKALQLAAQQGWTVCTVSQLLAVVPADKN